MVAWQMINHETADIKNQLLSFLNQEEPEIIEEKIVNEGLVLTLNSIPDLNIEIGEDGITVNYGREHEDFWLKPYKNAHALVQDVYRFISILINNIILFEYEYAKSKLLSYKIWAISRNGKQRKLMKKVIVSSNPFLRLAPKTLSSEEMCFKISK